MSDALDIAKEVLHWITKPRYSFCIMVCGLLILTVPLPEFLLLETVRDDFGKYIGVVTLLAAVVWVVEMLLLAWNGFVGWMEKRREKNDLLSYLHTLDSGEAHLFCMAATNGTQTVHYHRGAEETVSLIAKGLLLSVPDDPSMFNLPFIIPKIVWDEIIKPKVLAKIKERDGQRTT